MEFTMMLFQLTVFSELNRDIAKSFVLSFDESYTKVATDSILQKSPWFRITAQDQSFSIDVAENRIDCYYREFSEKSYSNFINIVKMIQLANPITRIALNYSNFIKDEEGLEKNKFNKYFNFYNNYGEAEEILFRINHQKELETLKFNIITNCQSGIVQNSQTFENVKCLIFHYDINNVSVANIDQSKLEKYYQLMDIELKRLIQVEKDLLK